MSCQHVTYAGHAAFLSAYFVALPLLHVQGNLPLTEEEKEFIQMLQADVDRINIYFIEREEEAVIKLQALIDRREALQCRRDVSDVPGSPSSNESLRAAFIDFHGEMVLLLHWSLVNYAGIVKILKKHDKLLGGHAQKIYLQNILQQPFTSTENISKLVREAESQAQSLGIRQEFGRPNRVTEDENIGRQEKREAKLLKRTRAALGMLSELQDGAHTPSTLLPSKHQLEQKT